MALHSVVVDPLVGVKTRDDLLHAEIVDIFVDVLDRLPTEQEMTYYFHPFRTGLLSSTALAAKIRTSEEEGTTVPEQSRHHWSRTGLQCLSNGAFVIDTEKLALPTTLLTVPKKGLQDVTGLFSKRYFAVLFGLQSAGAGAADRVALRANEFDPFHDRFDTFDNDGVLSAFLMAKTKSFALYALPTAVDRWIGQRTAASAPHYTPMRQMLQVKPHASVGRNQMTNIVSKSGDVLHLERVTVTASSENGAIALFVGSKTAGIVLTEDAQTSAPVLIGYNDNGITEPLSQQLHALLQPLAKDIIGHPGATFRRRAKDHRLEVASVFPKSPAASAGLLVGDVVTCYGVQSCADMVGFAGASMLSNAASCALARDKPLVFVTKRHVRVFEAMRVFELATTSCGEDAPPPQPAAESRPQTRPGPPTRVAVAAARQTADMRPRAVPVRRPTVRDIDPKEEPPHHQQQQQQHLPDPPPSEMKLPCNCGKPRCRKNVAYLRKMELATQRQQRRR